MWEVESQVTEYGDETATIKAPSDDGSEGVQLILNSSSTSDNTKVLKASAAFQSLGINDPKEDPFLNVLRESQKHGNQGDLRYGSTKEIDQREYENASPKADVTQTRSNSRNNGSDGNGFPPQSQNRPKSKPPILTAKQRGIWAEPPGLLTTRMAAQEAINVKKEQVKDKYIKGQIEDADIVVQVSRFFQSHTTPLSVTPLTRLRGTTSGRIRFEALGISLVGISKISVLSDTSTESTLIGMNPCDA